MGGKIYSMDIQDKTSNNFTSPNLDPEKIKISLENTNKLLGLELKEKDLEKLIPKMGHDYNSSKNEVSVPAWRVDILHEVDIIEDIAIAHGYENFEPTIPNIATSASEDPRNSLRSKIADSLTGLGLIETSTFHLVKDSELKLMKIPEEKQIRTVDSKTEYKTLRPNLLIPALRILSENKDNEYPQKTFEIGTVFPSLDSKEESGVLEKEELIISLTPNNFTETKQTLDYLFRSLNLKYELEESVHSELIEGRSGNITMNNKTVGRIGEVHPQLLRDWGLKMPLTIIQLNLKNILEN
jgi:phenylalanyl-tRNA synthetase beta chain